MIKSAAAILAEIDDTKPAPIPKGRRRRGTHLDRVEPFNHGPRPALGLEPRTQSSPRDDAYYADARAYRLAALEYGVHPLMARDLYAKNP